MLGNYRCWEQSMDIELCFSRDTHQWIRPLRGGWIPRGDIGDIDHMMVHAPNSLIDLGDRWRIIYSGTNIMHNKQMPEGIETARSDTMTADIPKGRFAGLSTTNRVLGTLTLKDFNLSSDIITVDADIQGRFQAELRDPYNRPLPGFELNRSIPVKGDSQCHVLRWQGEKTSDQYRYDTICMRIEMENGIIYSVSI